MKFRRRGPATLMLSGAVALFALSADFRVNATESESSPADKSAPAAAEEPVLASSESGLAARQEAISLKYKRFEKSLLEMGEAMKKSDPERAAVLFRAVGKSKEDRNPQQMAKVMELLKEERLGDATERQGELVGSLQALLDLLTSEDRDKKREQRKKEIEEYLKKLNKIIAGQKDVRAATERGESTEGLVPRQTKLSEKAQELRKDIDQADESRKKGSEEKESKPGDEPPDQKPAESQPGDEAPGEQKPNDKEQKGKSDDKKSPEGAEPSDEKSGESKPGEGEQGESEPGESKPGESKPVKANRDRVSLEKVSPKRRNPLRVKRRLNRPARKCNKPSKSSRRAAIATRPRIRTRHSKSSKRQRSRLEEDSPVAGRRTRQTAGRVGIPLPENARDASGRLQ